MKIQFTKSILIIAATLFSLATMNPANADGKKFKNKNMHGNWGFTATGKLVAPPPGVCPGLGFAMTPPCEFNAVGVMSFRKAQQCTIKVRMTVDGVPNPATGFRTTDDGGACEYTVDNDGTGNIFLNFPGEPTVTLTFVLVDKKKEFRFTRNDALQATGIAKKQ